MKNKVLIVAFSVAVLFGANLKAIRAQWETRSISPTGEVIIERPYEKPMQEQFLNQIRYFQAPEGQAVLKDQLAQVENGVAIGRISPEELERYKEYYRFLMSPEGQVVIDTNVQHLDWKRNDANAIYTKAIGQRYYDI